MIRFFGMTFGCALLQIGYWAVVLLFLPWSVAFLPLIGLWFILFAENFLLYNTLDGVFCIEEKIAQRMDAQRASVTFSFHSPPPGLLPPK